MDKFAQRLKEAMDNKHIKAIDLARRSNCSRSLVSQYLSGKCVAKQENIYRMASVLGVSPSWLMGYSDAVTEYESLKEKVVNRIDFLTTDELIQLDRMIDVMFGGGK